MESRSPDGASGQPSGVPGHRCRRSPAAQSSHGPALTSGPDGDCAQPLHDPDRDPDFPDAAAEARWLGQALGTAPLLGEGAGHCNFGVNLTELAPGAVSALRHAHTTQDEFVYVLQGHPVLRTDAGDTTLAPGMCAGFRAGSGDAHQLVNPTEETAVYPEIGDRSAGDTVTYPDDDLVATLNDGRWVFTHKDGRPS